jgi:threonine/homoserine/homoserine lactone efflux protein
MAIGQMWIYLLQGCTFGLAAAVTPGPLALFIISEAISNGWRRAMPAAFSPLISDGPIAILVLAVLSRMPTRMILCMRLSGGAFILYLAYGAWKTWRTLDLENTSKTMQGPSNVLKAAVINWLNPNPYIGWSVVMGPIFLSGLRTSTANGIAFLAGFYVLMIATMIGMTLLFSAAQKMGRRVQKIMIALSSIALACFGIYQVWIGISAVL